MYTHSPRNIILGYLLKTENQNNISVRAENFTTVNFLVPWTMFLRLEGLLYFIRRYYITTWRKCGSHKKNVLWKILDLYAYVDHCFEGTTMLKVIMRNTKQTEKYSNHSMIAIKWWDLIYIWALEFEPFYTSIITDFGSMSEFTR